MNSAYPRYRGATALSVAADQALTCERRWLELKYGHLAGGARWLTRSPIGQITGACDTDPVLTALILTGALRPPSQQPQAHANSSEHRRSTLKLSPFHACHLIHTKAFLQ